MVCTSLRGFLTALTLMDAEGEDIRMVHHGGDTQPVSSVKQGEITKTGREKRGFPAVLCGTETQSSCEPLPPNCPSHLAWPHKHCPR